MLRADDGLLNDVRSELKLSAREAKVLLKLLQDGPLTVNELSQELGIASPHIYTILKKLSRRGLVASTPGRPSRYFACGVSEALRSELSAKMRRLERLVKTVESWEKNSSVSLNTAFYDNGSRFVSRLLSSFREANLVLWAVLPSKEFINSLFETAVEAWKRGCNVRLAIGDRDFLKGFLETPTYIRYIEPPPPFLLAVVDERAFFAPLLFGKVVWGLETAAPYAVKELSAYFEHIWTDDYMQTLSRLRMTSPKEY